MTPVVLLNFYAVGVSFHIYFFGLYKCIVTEEYDTSIREQYGLYFIPHFYGILEGGSDGLRQEYRRTDVFNLYKSVK